MVHPTWATQVTGGIEVCHGRIKNMKIAGELDPSFDIVWDWAIRVSHRIEERLEFRWEEGFGDVLC